MARFKLSRVSGAPSPLAVVCLIGIVSSPDEEDSWSFVKELASNEPSLICCSAVSPTKPLTSLSSPSILIINNDSEYQRTVAPRLQGLLTGLSHVVGRNNHPLLLVSNKRRTEVVGRISIFSFDIAHMTARQLKETTGNKHTTIRLRFL